MIILLHWLETVFPVTTVLVLAVPVTFEISCTLVAPVVWSDNSPEAPMKLEFDDEFELLRPVMLLELFDSDPLNPLADIDVVLPADVTADKPKNIPPF